MLTQYLEIKARVAADMYFYYKSAAEMSWTHTKTVAYIIPEPTARSAVPGVSPGRGLLIPQGYLHPSKSKHSEV